ncbi:cytochrome P450 [Cellulomonas marina]|uniref:Cytochrome P450 n=1 Tax=Cellulomonas marina TaxID=988821 RepID=A0A1I0Z2P3_9CELL|nr:cytochrome P450 [Cellulomonas marina]GIG28206.1 cytochrome P450 [Cellulomonas marina]SFB19895.1 Cytochrome P450 [Cellulomonas marina]
MTDTAHPTATPTTTATSTATSGDRRPPVLPRATPVETLQVLGGLVVPLLARGVIVRRPAAEALAERFDADARAVRLLQRLRHRHGEGPLRLRLPGRRMVVLLAPQHVHRVLDGTPVPFTAATKEKRAALGHLEPHNVLISSAEERARRRPFHDAVLDSASPVHHAAGPLVRAVVDEADGLLADAAARGELDWDAYVAHWYRAVRRLVLGEGAADDTDLTDDLRRLRAAGNWAFLRPRRRALQRRFWSRLGEHLERAEPGSLAAHAARVPVEPGTDVVQQVVQWLFAFDAAAWSGIRALALVATHPAHAARVQGEVAGRDLAVPQDLPLLRATLLESLRLWPTTPAVLRESVERTRWEGGPMPEATSILTYAPFFHRDAEHLPQADAFDPRLWDERAGGAVAGEWPLVPFSAGPAACPGRNLVLETTSTFLGRLVQGHDVELLGRPRLAPDGPLPGSLDPFTLRFAVRPRDVSR